MVTWKIPCALLRCNFLYSIVYSSRHTTTLTVRRWRMFTTCPTDSCLSVEGRSFVGRLADSPVWFLQFVTLPTLQFQLGCRYCNCHCLLNFTKQSSKIRNTWGYRVAKPGSSFLESPSTSWRTDYRSIGWINSMDILDWEMWKAFYSKEKSTTLLTTSLIVSENRDNDTMATQSDVREKKHIDH